MESVLYIVILLHISTFIGFAFFLMTTIMLTKKFPPIATAGGPPTATGDTILDVPTETAMFDQEYLDNYDLDVEGGDEYTLGQKMVHYCGGNITQSHWIACKACLAFFAGAATRKMLTSTKALKEASCLQVYVGAIDALDDTHLDMDAKVFFHHSLQQNKDEPMTALALYRYYQDTRSKVRNQVLPFFPKDLVSMKSGRGFHESCNEVFIKAYRDGLVKKYTKEEADRMLPPPLREYTRAPWYFSLLVKKNCRDPQLVALYVADVMHDETNLPISRAEIERQKQVGIAAAGVQIPIVSTSIVPTARVAVASDSSSVGGISCVKVVPSVQQMQLLWAKITASKQGTEGKHKHCQEDRKDGGIGTGNDPFGKDEASNWTIV